MHPAACWRRNLAIVKKGTCRPGKQLKITEQPVLSFFLKFSKADAVLMFYKYYLGNSQACSRMTKRNPTPSTEKSKVNDHFREKSAGLGTQTGTRSSRAGTLLYERGHNCVESEQRTLVLAGGATLPSSRKVRISAVNNPKLLYLLIAAPAIFFFWSFRRQTKFFDMYKIIPYEGNVSSGWCKTFVVKGLFSKLSKTPSFDERVNPEAFVLVPYR